MSEVIRLDPKPENNCFGCGGGNDWGMKLAFDLLVDERKTRGRFILGPRYGGGAGFGHGGIIAVLLDEAMGKISKLTEERAVTAELSVEYKRPVPLNEEILVEGWQEGEKGRNRFRVGEIRDAKGNLLARGTGRFVVISTTSTA
jgi:acyl-coenzyme A thioesterase PaaI-like protein